MNIKLHIEELVLHGFASKDQNAMSDAIQGELTRLLNEGGLSHSLKQQEQIARLDGGTFQRARESKPETVGGQVAQGVYQAINGGEK
jgi:hypothetical protein